MGLESRSTGGMGTMNIRAIAVGILMFIPPVVITIMCLKKNVPIPAENEFTFEGKQCVIAPALGARPVNTDAYVSYSYNKTGKCGGPPQNIPLNDHVWMMLLLVAGFGALAIKKKMINSSMV